jgi:hypothetical protein
VHGRRLRRISRSIRKRPRDIVKAVPLRQNRELSKRFAVRRPAEFVPNNRGNRQPGTLRELLLSVSKRQPKAPRGIR